MNDHKKPRLNQCHTPKRDLRNSLLMSAWILGWALSWAAVGLSIRKGWLPQGPLTVLGILCVIGIGLGMILSYCKYLRNTDELQRKIQLEALAVALGVTLVGSSTFSLLQRAGLVGEAGIPSVVMMVSLTYSAAVFIGQWRYA